VDISAAHLQVQVVDAGTEATTPALLADRDGGRGLDIIRHLGRLIDITGRDGHRVAALLPLPFRNGADHD
jgi:hypothetical protein